MIEMHITTLVMIILGTAMFATAIYAFMVASGKASREEEKHES
jgi:hypothetical protein